jgi:hypothetical protein
MSLSRNIHLHNTHTHTSCIHRYLVGLEKLNSSAQQVAGMQAELVALQPQLIKTVGEVEVLMEKITVEKRDVVEPKVGARGRARGEGVCEWKGVQERAGGAANAVFVVCLRARREGVPCTAFNLNPSFLPCPQAAIVKVDEAKAQEKADAAKAIKVSLSMCMGNLVSSHCEVHH